MNAASPKPYRVASWLLWITTVASWSVVVIADNPALRSGASIVGMLAFVGSGVVLILQTRAAGKLGGKQ